MGALSSPLIWHFRQTQTLCSLHVIDPYDPQSFTQEIHEACEGLKNNTVKELKLNRLVGDHEVEYLAKFLGSNTSLRKLDLSQNSISMHGAAALTKALKENTSLIELDLRHNKICPIGANTLLSGLLLHRSLSELRLDGNPCKEEIDREWENLEYWLKSDRTLKKERVSKIISDLKTEMFKNNGIEPAAISELGLDIFTEVSILIPLSKITGPMRVIQEIDQCLTNNHNSARTKSLHELCTNIISNTNFI